MTTEQQNVTAWLQQSMPQPTPQDTGRNFTRQPHFSLTMCNKCAIFDTNNSTDMDRINSSIPDRVQEQIEQHITEIAEQVNAIAKQHNVPQRIADGIVLDYTDVLQDNLAETGLHLNFKDIWELYGHTLPQHWQPLTQDNVVMQGLLLIDYKTAAQTVQQIQEACKNITDDAERKKAAVKFAIQQADSTPSKAAGSFEALKYFGVYLQYLHDVSIIYRHLQCILGLRALFFTTDDELRPIHPLHCDTAMQRTMQKENKNILRQAAEAAQQNAGKLQTKILQTPAMKKVTAGIYQNLSKALAGSMQVAEADENSGSPAVFMPLMVRLQEDARNSLPTTTQTYALQVLKGIGMLPTIAKKAGETPDMIQYNITLGDFIRAAGSGQNPTGIKNRQTAEGTELTDAKEYNTLRNYYNALRYFSTHYITIPEWRQVIRKRRGGKVEYTNSWKEGTLQIIPITAHFYKDGHKLKPEDMISGTTEVSLMIHKAIAQGRAMAIVPKRLNRNDNDELIRLPVRYFFPLETSQAFNMPHEIRFFNLILLTTHKMELKQWTENIPPAEDDILAQVFDYRARLKAASTPEERKKTAESIKRHKPRDRETLQALFDKAKRIGLITYYTRRQAADGINFVWEWLRSTEIKEDKRTDAAQ